MSHYQLINQYSKCLRLYFLLIFITIPKFADIKFMYFFFS